MKWKAQHSVHRLLNSLTGNMLHVVDPERNVSHMLSCKERQLEHTKLKVIRLITSPVKTEDVWSGFRTPFNISENRCTIPSNSFHTNSNFVSLWSHYQFYVWMWWNSARGGAFASVLRLFLAFRRNSKTLHNKEVIPLHCIRGQGQLF